MIETELVAAALKARNAAYAPYSNFHVGAAILSASGDVFCGCNVENGSYGLAVCAERNAIGAMVAAGQREIVKIVVAAAPLASPCGACRQCIVEFGRDIEVISVNADDLEIVRRWPIGDLIPDHFDFQDD